jgi:hypothetical protein
MKTIDITISGVTPLLCCRWNESAEAEKDTRRTLREKKTPREEAESYAYKGPNGYGFPLAAIVRGIAEAGSNHKLTGSRKSAKFAVMGSVIPVGEFALLVQPGTTKPIESFEVDSRRVVIPATKGAITRHRPRFDAWSMSFALRINDNIVPVPFIEKLLNEMGETIGIGAFRPAKSGPFGTFQVVMWKDQTKQAA